MGIKPDEKDDKAKKRPGSPKPATKVKEKDLGDEQYWGQGRQQKERNAGD